MLNKIQQTSFKMQNVAPYKKVRETSRPKTRRKLGNKNGNLLILKCSWSFAVSATEGTARWGQRQDLCEVIFKWDPSEKKPGFTNYYTLGKKVARKKYHQGFPGGPVVKDLPWNAGKSFLKKCSSVLGKRRFHMPQGN